ncbi:Predicted DNA-binding transcriptional regulator YafY, contains an HTH and WYL domains [Flavobacterium omnivorum]|uniref:Predicted DNA-binding transcriptional regulator YafY, contains an HTH and WYL domains n=1 Tax=Flavobacterium omnivorum TaxID=178355 RepID=A0A1G8H5W3_9FLAO|nr:WYL domain-containing protein [Flavobacterium omnivorum]SDI01949.1 Predicted DNA-binding transcriptional regulator YafY, contains an HTH and WYL domains [Flavobacterium omnivorum]
MFTTKHQIVRYNKLDRCFQNLGKEYSIDDLLDAVNESIIEFDSKSSGVEIRTLRKDISFMRSESGYNAPIETIKGSNGINYYRYSDKSFSINSSPLNDTEAQQLKNAVSILQRFEGSPEFEWVNEIAPLLNDKFGLKNQDQKVMSLESNIDYKGYKHITPLFNAIINKSVIKVKYEPFNTPEYTVTFHPYFLKQYNNRWFVFGYNEFNQNQHWNLALDRINGDIEKTNEKYREDTTDWVDFFDDIIGVSKDLNKQLEEVKLIFSKEQAPYIDTKPLHWSQKTKLLEDGSLEVRIKVMLNYELEMRILSFGEKVKVIAPEDLVTTISNRIKLLKERY